MPGISEASSLLFRASLHFLLLALPCFALCVLAVRKGIRDTVLLGAIGLAATAMSGYPLFFLWFFFSFHFVRPWVCIVDATALCYLLLEVRRLSGEEWRFLRPLLCPALLVFTSTLLVLASAFAYGGFEDPLKAAQSRFSHQLPGDNTLPYILAEDMMRGTHQIPHPFWGDWLASDRPPLQTAFLLSQYPAVITPPDVSYEILSALLQSFWIFGVWLLLYAMGIHRRAIAYILAGSLFTNFIFVNTLFVWPKLLAASYFLGVAALLLSRRLATTAGHRWLAGGSAGVLLAWSFLSHGGTMFALLGIAPVLFFLRRSLSWKPLGLLFAAAAILYLPWSLYQKFSDPPGDRLLKWHLAGVVPIDARPFAKTISDSYRALAMDQILANKFSNFQTAFGHLDFFPGVGALVFKSPPKGQSPSDFRTALGRDLNGMNFFFFIPNTGFYILGLPLLLLGPLRRFHSAEWKTALLFWSIVALTNVIWCCLLFGPKATVVHQGSYVPELLAYAAGILCLWSLSELLAILAVALQASLFTYVEFVVLQPASALHASMAALAGLAFIATMFLLCRLAATHEKQG